MGNLTRDPGNRKIIHIDMDAFFAQVEQRDNPDYKNMPLIVGGPLNRGVVSTASYEARKYGIHSGMPLSRAKRLCPRGIFVPVNMEKYLKESARIRAIFHNFTPLVETIGCDEGFLDVTGCERLFGDVLEIAKKIKGKIYEETNLTSSAGIGPNKFMAKLASGIGKPNGLTVLKKTPEMIEKIKMLPVSYIWGVGRVAHRELVSMGIMTIGDLSRAPLKVVESKFGEAGRIIHEMANGMDRRPVIPDQEPKSIGREITFRKDIDDPGMLGSVMLMLSQKIARNLRSRKYRGKVITLKIRFSDFRTITRRLTLKNHTYGIFDIYKSALYLLKSTDLNRKKIRLTGISVSSLKPVFIPEDIFYTGPSREENLTDAIGDISDKFGEDKVTLAKIVERDDITDR